MGLTYYRPNISGVTQYAVILAEALAKRKYIVEVISSADRSREGVEVVEDISINRVAGLRLGKGYLMPTYPFVSWKLVKKSDVVNCHLPSIESFWLAVWAKLLGKKLVVSHHCEFQPTGKWSNKLIALLTYPIHLVVYLLADKIVAYTEDYAATSIFLRHFEGKTKYILPPIKVEDKKIGVKLPTKKGKVVGFAGRIGWEKGIDILIKAMEKVDGELWLAGPYEGVVGDNTYEKLIKIINKKVKFLGPIKHEQMADFYRTIDCLVLPSTDNLETFGIVQAEAMVCGTPVVASNLPGVRVPIRLTGMGEIAKVGNTNDLAEKINKVLKMKVTGSQVAKAQSIFDLKKFVNRYEEIFDELLQK